MKILAYKQIFSLFCIALSEHNIYKQMNKQLLPLLSAGLLSLNLAAERPANTLWAIGKADNSAAEFALAPDGYKQFLANDFGYEDKY